MDFEREELDPPELRQLAVDMITGKVFSTLHLNQVPHLTLKMVFMPIMQMSDEDRTKLKEIDPGLIYEYLSEPHVKGIGDSPAFYTFQYLTQDEFGMFQTYYNALSRATGHAD